MQAGAVGGNGVSSVRDTTIVVVVRDRVSPMVEALRSIEATTGDEPVLVVAGGLDDEHQRRLQAAFGGPRFEFVFTDSMLGPQEARNIALRRCSTRLMACTEADVTHQPGWLHALHRCQLETGAAVVVPLVLERPNTIHCAGNDLYVDFYDGLALGHKVLRHFGRPFHGASNLVRQPSAYGELHCQLFDCATMADSGAFDESLIEMGEVDQGLTLRAEAHEIWFEPGAVVLFDRFRPLEAVDIDHFLHRWDTSRLMTTLDHFYEKWGFDISEDGGFKHFMVETMSELPRSARLRRSDRALRLSRVLRRRATTLLRLPISLRNGRDHRLADAETWDKWSSQLRTRPRPELSPRVAHLLAGAGRPSAG